MSRTADNSEATLRAVARAASLKADLRNANPPPDLRPVFSFGSGGAVSDRAGQLIYTPETAGGKK